MGCFKIRFKKMCDSCQTRMKFKWQEKKKENTCEISEKDKKEGHSGLISIALVWYAVINRNRWPLLHKPFLTFWLVSVFPFVLPNLFTSTVVNVSMKEI